VPYTAISVNAVHGRWSLTTGSYVMLFPTTLCSTHGTARLHSSNFQGLPYSRPKSQEQCVTRLHVGVQKGVPNARPVLDALAILRFVHTCDVSLPFQCPVLNVSIQPSHNVVMSFHGTRHHRLWNSTWKVSQHRIEYFPTMFQILL
jgi:hypothetical protein